MANEPNYSSNPSKDEPKKEKVRVIPLEYIDEFPGHPFKVLDDESMQKLMNSIEEIGVQSPIVARIKEDQRYEIISGHRRVHACRKLGLKLIPAIVRDLSRDEAIIAMVDANLQREHILPSEKAFAYKMKLEAIKHQGKASTQLAQKLSVELVGDAAGESKDQVRRYIRLTELIPDILQMVDDGKIALTPAVELSYLQDFEQEALFSIMDCDEVTPSLSQAQRLRRMSEDQTFTDRTAMQVLSEVKGNQKEYVKVPVDSLRSYFRPDTSIKQMTETLVKAMEFYNKHLERQRRDRDAR